MNSFMLWWDGSKSTVKEKIDVAVSYYIKKYGRIPELICVNYDVPVSELRDYKGLKIRPSILVTKNCLFVGMNDD